MFPSEDIEPCLFTYAMNTQGFEETIGHSGPASNLLLAGQLDRMIDGTAAQNNEEGAYNPN